MRTTGLITIILLLTTSVKSQTDSTATVGDSSKFVIPFHLMFGTKQFNSSFYDQLNTLDKFKIFQPVTLIGLGFNGQFIVNREYHHNGHLNLLLVVPQDITINNQQGKLTGFIFSCSLFGVDLLKKKRNSKLIISVGFNTGRLRIYQNQLLAQKNPFFAPMISFLPKFTIKRITLGLNIQYDYDISSLNWRKTLFTSDHKTLLDKFQQTGLTTLFFIGEYF